MNTDVLIRRAELLPPPIQQQFADYLTFLLEKYVGHPFPLENEADESEDDFEFSKGEIAEFDNRLANAEAHPETTLTFEELVAKTREKYGLQL